ncbi:MAG: hypothetical protein K2X81_22965 [Candidatus Obscuribacterales bacterium]|nr:hypothetical protein [Candidatus Obscuribacterales bacterium]
MKVLYLATVCHLLFGGLPVFAQGQSGESNAAEQSFVLQGGVEHSEKLAPVEKSFRHGAKIIEEKPVNDESGNHWYMLPGWAVGSWTSTKSTRTYARDLRSGQEQLSPETRVTKMAFSWGFQQDNEGHVWEFAKEPYVLTLDSPEHKVVKRILKRDFAVANDSRIVLKMLTENIVVDKSSDRIKRTLQVENIQSCVPSAHECMSCTASYKIFDELGKPIEIGKELNTARRVAPFKSVDEYEGKNMRQLFADFMHSHNRSELIESSQK